jgi:hypothetical protein
MGSAITAVASADLAIIMLRVLHLLLHLPLQTFNKVDVSRHQFALDWMNDFETFAQGVWATASTCMTALGLAVLAALLRPAKWDAAKGDHSAQRHATGICAAASAAAESVALCCSVVLCSAGG